MNRFARSVVLVTSAMSSLLLACSSTGNEDTAAGTEGIGRRNGTCPACLSDSDCAQGSVCGQFQGDIFCAPACPNGDECATNRSCETISTASGDETAVCVPNANACGEDVGPDSLQADARKKKDAGGGSACGSLVDPGTPAACHSCGTTHTCQPNGCYGGWWCDTSTDRCQAPPTGCGGTDAGPGSPDAGDPDAAGPDSGEDAGMDASPPADAGGDAGDGGGGGGGSIGENGGTTDSLYFAVVGDTRPPVINDTAGYPSAVIQEIYGDITALSPMPLWTVSTGDYIFSSSNGGQSTKQFPLYQAARAQYPGVLFPAMGNHECTGAVNSNCGPGTTTGSTTNYSDFLSTMLAPIHKTTPNYSVRIDSTTGAWTSKFVFVAGNAWTTDDATWLDGVLAQPTTYTFIVRHEPKAASTAPGCAASEKIMANHPYTLAIVGHTHTYGKTGPKQVTIGNGGAPLTGGATYGYGTITQRADGAIQVDMINYQTGKPDLNFRFALNADGTAAP